MSRADVVIIGGGIVGVCAALYLARSGIATALCEKGDIGCEQSSRNWGWLRKMMRDPRELPLAIESLRLWQGMQTIGVETGFETCGIMYLCGTLADLARLESWLPHAREYQIGTHALTGREVANLMPGLGKPFAGALYTPSDARAEPRIAVRSIANAARQSGATIITNCAVRGIETTAGRVSGVVTENGHIACERVVLAGGTWSGLFCGNLGIELPQLKILGSVIRTSRVNGPEISALGDQFGFRKRLDGGYTVATLGIQTIDIVPDTLRFALNYWPMWKAHRRQLRFRLGHRWIEEWRIPKRWRLDQPTPFEAMRVLDPQPDPVAIDQAMTSIAAAFPEFRGMSVLERWGGIVDVTPDALPVVSAVDHLPGFFIATGLSGHGFGTGPGVGKMIADMVVGKIPSIDPHPFRLSRFADGSKPQPDPLAS